MQSFLLPFIIVIKICYTLVVGVKMKNNNHDYKIIKACNVKNWESQAIEILKKSILLDYSEIGGMSEKDEGTYEQWIKIYLKDPNYIYLLYYNNEYVGYFHSIILTEEASKKMLSGDLPDSCIRENHLLAFPYNPGHYNMYCVCICIRGEHQDKGLGSMLFDNLMMDIEKLKRDNVYIDNIIANVYTESGRSFSKKRDFIFTGVTINNGEIAVKKLNI
jgi:hypothetical protein